MKTKLTIILLFICAIANAATNLYVISTGAGVAYITITALSNSYDRIILKDDNLF